MLAILLAIACGAERADVKLLADVHPQFFENASKLPVRSCTIAELRQVPQPKKWTPTLPRMLSEMRICEVKVWVTEYKLEADLDFHVVIEDENHDTMIAEFPAPACAKDPKLKGIFSTARSALLKLLPHPPTPQVKRLASPRPVTFVGVVFIDKLHGQLGVAPNGVELHPVLEVR